MNWLKKLFGKNGGVKTRSKKREQLKRLVSMSRDYSSSNSSAGSSDLLDPTNIRSRINPISPIYIWDSHSPSHDYRSSHFHNDSPSYDSNGHSHNYDSGSIFDSE